MLFPQSEHPEISLVFFLYQQIRDVERTPAINKFIMEYVISNEILALIGDALHVEIIV